MKNARWLLLLLLLGGSCTRVVEVLSTRGEAAPEGDLLSTSHALSEAPSFEAGSERARSGLVPITHWTGVE